jgi:hypothetical protein
MQKLTRKTTNRKAHINSPALPGPPLSQEEFRDWILAAEKMPTISLQEAKAEWDIQKKKLQKLIK